MINSIELATREHNHILW